MSHDAVKRANDDFDHYMEATVRLRDHVERLSQALWVLEAHAEGCDVCATGLDPTFVLTQIRSAWAAVEKLSDLPIEP